MSIQRGLLFVLVCVGCASAEVDPDASGGGPPDAQGAIDGAVVDASPDATTPDATAPDAVPPDAVPPDATPIDAMLQARSVLDDTAGELSAGAATLTSATVEPWGAIAPVAYYTGGLLQRGSDTGVFTDGTTATWADVAAMTPTTRAAIEWRTTQDWGAGTPPSVGLTGPDDWTQWWQGEIYLEAGTWTFYLLADDHAFLDLAPAGSTDFARVVSCNWDVEGSGTFTAAAAGWYPLRYAVAEQGGSALANLRFAGPSVAQQAIPRHRLRARVDQIAGLFQVAWDDSRGVGDHETTIDHVTPGNTNWNTGNPGDLALTAADTFTTRWTGQVRIDVAGTYTFRLNTDDGQRLWIDGVKYLDFWTDTTNNNVTAAVALDAGWHDLVIDHSENAGGAAAILSVESGPELAGQTLPLDRQRPVEGRAERLSSGVNRTDVAVPDAGQAETAIALTAPVGALVTSVDVSYAIAHTYSGDLEVRLRAPNGTEFLLRDNTGGATDNAIDKMVTTGLNGAPASGTWTLRVNDTLSSDTGTIQDFQLTVHYAGGDPPIPTTASYESTVRDLGNAVSIDSVDWGERLPAGADVQLRVRTCAAPGDCASAAWSAPITAPGGTDPGVTAQRYLQYRVDLTSNGDRAPAVEWVRIDYQIAP